MIEREHTTSQQETGDVTLSDEMSALFAQLDPQQVQQFYNSYQIWLHQRRLSLLHLQAEALQEAIRDNAELMERERPSAIALSALSQLQASGVDDLDLLDRMLARGDAWLDQALQLLAQCERMGFIQGNYTLWCENALDGAYDWLLTMNEADIADEAPVASTTEVTPPSAEPLKEVTEDLLLQKLMSEEWEDTFKRPAITRPLVALEQDFFLSLPPVPRPARGEDFFLSLPTVPRSAPAEDFFLSLPTVPRPALAEDFFLSLPPVPQPAIDRPPTPEQQGEDEATSYTDSGVTAVIPRTSIGARFRPEQDEDHRVGDVTEKVAVRDSALVASPPIHEDEAPHQNDASQPWKEVTQYEMSTPQADAPLSERQAAPVQAGEPRRNIGLFRRLLNWLLGRTSDA